MRLDFNLSTILLRGEFLQWVCNVVVHVYLQHGVLKSVKLVMMHLLTIARLRDQVHLQLWSSCYGAVSLAGINLIHLLYSSSPVPCDHFTISHILLNSIRIEPD